MMLGFEPFSADVNILITGILRPIFHDNTSLSLFVFYPVSTRSFMNHFIRKPYYVKVGNNW